MTQPDNGKPGFRRPAQQRRPRVAKQDRKTAADKRRHESDKLDEALIETFPASDPAVSTPRKS
jgi:hypothetical protein